MLRDVFYYGEKPNVHPRERHAIDLADAKSKCTTEHFWVINEFCNYKNFDWGWDFDFLPDEDVWAEDHNNVWPSPYQKDSGTWLCSTNIDAITVYRSDVDPIPLKDEIKSNWKIIEYIDESKFDFKWHPDPTDPPYIYVFGNEWYPGTIMPTVEYHVPGATDRKFVTDKIAKLLQMPMLFKTIYDCIDFDYSWRPDPTSPPYIYVFGNTQYSGTIMPTVEFHVEGATERKYINSIVAKLAPRPHAFKFLEDIDTRSFDCSWVPDPTSPPYIYVWGNQWNKAQDKASVIYEVEGATEYKFMDQIVIRQPCMDNWVVPEHMVKETFDFSWEPNPHDPPYIYQFGTQWQKTGGPKYVVQGATEIKYIDSVKAQVFCYQFKNWLIPKNIDQTKFDFSWHPDDTEEPYIYQFPDQWARSGGPRFIVEGATQVKYVDAQVAVAKPDKTHWIIPEDIDTTDFDFSWHPDIEDKPYIYQFGTQWQKTNGPKFYAVGVNEGDEIKYIDVIKAKALPYKENWTTLISVDNFDYSWHPDATENPYIYIFGNQWNRAEIEPTLIYKMQGATEKKYINDIDIKASVYTEGWETLEDIESFDYSWRPDPGDPEYVYVFGNKQYDGIIMPTVKLHNNNATQEKFVDEISATLAQRPDLFTNTDLIKDFDYSWRPNPKDPPYVYQFGTQWAKTHGPTYTVEGAIDSKFVSEPVATILPDMTHWVIPDGVDVTKFDFSWHPDGTSPPYIYQFGTLLDEKDGPKYITPGHDGTIVHLERKEIVLEELEFPKYHIKTTLEDLINEHEGEIFWAINPEIDYSEFDFKWVPDKKNVYHINAFGSKDNINTQTYFVNGKMWQKGYRDINYIEDKLVELRTKIDIFYVDKGNPESQERFNKLKEKFSNITKTRYLNSWVDTINRCITKSTTNLCWILNSELDYDDFEFDYYPSPWQMRMVHVFGTQWSHWGTTFMVNKNSFAEDTKYVKIIEHLSNLNFVKRKTAKATNCLYDIYLIDHGNTLPNSINGMNYTTIKYENSYFKTFKKLLKGLPTKKEHYIWICSSICDYSNFDFSYICDPYAKEQLHVFPSDKQKFGDTFLIDVNKFRSLVDDMIMMEDYEKINYNQHQRVKRLLPPTIVTEDDTLTKAIFTDFNFPYAVFKTTDNKDLDVLDTEPISLWTNETKTIVVTSTGASRIIVPKEAKEYVEQELYDYPYISRSNKLAQSHPLDIVFLSNGEKNADENYEHLLKVTKGLGNRVVRVDGINGRVNAYHAAAKASETPWMFTVFAKLKVNEKFDWNWQPDRLQIPKHYIFYATNPVNGLEYGHQAMIAYNKKITLANTGIGLDFTLDNAHEVVELNSGVAHYNLDEFTTWRTAFREALKLRKDISDISIKRLDTWLTVANGDFAQYSLQGANDAVNYYEEVNGDLDQLRLSYDWEWLRNRFNK
jgi:hypothetical protein